MQPYPAGVVDSVATPTPVIPTAAEAVPSPTPTLPPTPEPTATPTIDGVQVPYRSQFDGTIYEGSNCGVAAIAMALEHYGRNTSILGLREAINGMTGDWNPDSGLAWQHMKQAAEQQGLTTSGLHNADGSYRIWTMGDLLTEARQGRPVILLMHYRSLPGHENADWYGDHYIVFLGMTSDGRVVYHDPAFRLDKGETGAFMTIDQGVFERAWSQTWVGENRTAMAVYPA